MTNILECAHQCAQLGLYVFPVHGVSNGKCTCNNPACSSIGKHPWTKNGHKDATNDPNKIPGMFANKPNCNIGIATGEGSSITVVDIDPRNGGEESLAKLPQMPKTLTCITGGGGKHFFFKYSKKIKSGTHKLGRGIDIKSDGGYVVAAPSLHSSGNRYAWEDASATIAELPDWIFDKLEEDKPKPEPIPELVLKGGRNHALTSLAGSLNRRGVKGEALFVALGALNQQICEEPLPEEEVRAIAKSVSGYDSEVQLAIEKEGCNTTDVGNAELFRKKYGAEVLYCGGFWHYWNGKYWESDNDKAVTRLYIEFVKKLDIDEFLPYLDEKDKGKQFRKHLRNSEQKYKISAAMDIASYFLRKKSEQLDSDDFLITLQNGTLNLRTRRLQSSSKEDYITSALEFSYDRKANCPTFKKFILEVMNGDKEMVKYVQKIFGYCLTGDVSEQCFFIFLGDGANGKSTLVEAILYVLGILGRTASFDAFLSKRGGVIRNDLARLFGCRMVTSSEPPVNQAFDEALLKKLTGGDTVTVRFLYKENFEYKPKFKIIFCANKLPAIAGVDHGIWRRVRVVPFTVQFSKERQDKKLPEKLKAEAAGIFNWMLEGLKLWQAEGMHAPEKVENYTASYREKSDTLAQYITDACQVGDDLRVKTSTFYKAYTEWCKASQIWGISREDVAQKMAAKGYLKKKINGIYFYTGIAIQGDEDHDEY